MRSLSAKNLCPSVNKSFRYLRLFAGVNQVGFSFHFASLDEAQNAGQMEQSDAFYLSGFTN